MKTKLKIFLETTKSDKSDKLYVESVINLCEIDLSNYSIDYEYLGGKYNALKINPLINEYKKIIHSNDKFSDLKVIICIDKDNATTYSKDIQFLKDIKSFCTVNNYEVVYFNKNIEEVFLGRTVSNNKTKLALSYKKNLKVLPETLVKKLENKNPCTPGTSNLLHILKSISR